MASSRLMSGIFIVLFVLVTNLMAAFINTNSTATGSLSGCSSSDDNATCEHVGKTSFLASVLSTTFTGFGDSAPLIVNAAWGLIMTVLLSAAVLLIVLAFIPLTNS